MSEAGNIAIGTIFLILGIPIGDFIAKLANDELKAGTKWFRRIVFLSLLGTLLALIFRSDILMFSFAFIAIVTSRSLKDKRKRKRKK